MDADELDPVRTKLRRHFEEVELERTREAIRAYRDVDSQRPGPGDPAPVGFWRVLGERLRSLCAQGEVNDLFVSLLGPLLGRDAEPGDGVDGAPALWAELRASQTAFETQCEGGSYP
jgi:hypothetical protein